MSGACVSYAIRFSRTACSKRFFSNGCGGRIAEWCWGLCGETPTFSDVPIPAPVEETGSAVALESESLAADSSSVFCVDKPSTAVSSTLTLLVKIRTVGLFMLFSTPWLLMVVDLAGRLLYKLTISVDRCFAESGIGAAAWTSLRSCWRCPVGMPEERSFCVRLTAVCLDACAPLFPVLLSSSSTTCGIISRSCSAFCTCSSRKSNTLRLSEKRTSILDGWTLTSTCSVSICRWRYAIGNLCCIR